MSDYDFSTLNDKEFEVLTMDLLSAEYNTLIERFKAGKDGGIDGRFYEAKSNSNNLVIIQCKHWLKSGITKLISACEKTEANKIKKLSPNRYIFVTSLDLSPDNKSKIFDTFSPYILNTADILGKAELNALLTKYSEVERKHFKLWLSSINLLDTFLNNDVLGRSYFFTEIVKEFSPKYVLTSNHHEAIKKINELGCVIINGEPGIGKTTLAQQICLEFILNEYELVVIEDSISEAERVFHVGKKQIFYFDDFLGSNFLSIFQSKEDSHIINFMRRVARDKNKRFILTTRTNILSQGKKLSEKFEINHIDRNEYELQLSSLSKLDKAKILYNHIWFSDLPEDFIDQIYIDKRYKEIINHKKFNPRLISFITDFQRFNSIGSINYWNYIQTSLDNPKKLWRGVLTNQISDLERHLVIAITINQNNIRESELICFLENIRNNGIDNAREYITINNLARSLVGSVLNRTIYHDIVNYSLFNPSIADFVLSEYFDREDYILEMVTCLRTLDSLKNIKKICDEKITNIEFNSFFKKLLDKEAYNSNEPDTFTLNLIHTTFDNFDYDYNPLLNKIFALYGERIYEIFGFSSLKLLLTALRVNEEKYNGLSRIIVSEILETNLDVDDFAIISKIINLLPDNLLLVKLFKERFLEYFSKNATQLFIDDGYDPEYYELYGSIDSYIEEFVKDTLSDFDENIFSDTEIDDLYYSIDEDEIIEYFKDENDAGERDFDNHRDIYSDDKHDDSFDPIDDLFDRD